MTILLTLLWGVGFVYSFILYRARKESQLGLAAYAFAVRYSLRCGLLASAVTFARLISSMPTEHSPYTYFALGSALLASPAMGAIVGILASPILYLGALAFYHLRKQT